MQYQKNIKIIIDKRKLDVLTRIGCPDEKILSLLKTGKFEPTGDKLIDETLECLVDIREFDNWGGRRQGAGRPRKNQDENQLDIQDENQDGNQDANQLEDKDIVLDNNNNIYNTCSRPVDNVDNFPKRPENQEKTVQIVEGKFFLDDSIPEYKESTQGMTEGEMLKLWQWIMDRYQGRTLPMSKINTMIKNFNKRGKK